MTSHDAIVRSALWAAYGDGLGFITEFAREPTLLRLPEREVRRLIAWRRRIGGKFGIDLELPSGCYSDDTQLRLSTSRAIRGSGEFDVECFARVELPVWSAYALGAGRGTKAAAEGMTRPVARWSSNFFGPGGRDYVNSGGNGAAMRIQPHVWAASRGRPLAEVLQDIVRNAATTHGHPRGMIGAVFHALCLRHVLTANALPTPDDWRKLGHQAGSIPELIRNDSELAVAWVPMWEKIADRPLEESCRDVTTELLHDIDSLAALLDGSPRNRTPEETYREGVATLGGFAPETRGTGTKSALLAAFAAWSLGTSVHGALRTVANALGSDTDTIATMAGALLGAIADSDPPEAVWDVDYIRSEAERLSRISGGAAVDSFPYPDLLYWKPPRTHLETLGMADSSWAVAGLGPAKPNGDERRQNGSPPTIWQWFRLEFGQTILLRRRNAPKRLPASQLPARVGTKVMPAPATGGSMETRSRNIRGPFARSYPPTELPFAGFGRCTLDEATDVVIRSDFDPRRLGEAFLAVTEGPGGVEQGIAFAAIIAKARLARKRRR